MRADEYLVEMIKTTKEENEKLKKEHEKLKKEKKDLLQQIDTLSHKNDKSVNITKTIGELYSLDYLSDYKIKNAIEKNKITIEDLEQSLIDDSKLLQTYDKEIDNGDYRLAHVYVQKYNYLVNYLDSIAALIIYDFSNEISFNCYKIDNKCYFLDYEQAKKALIEKARKEIRKALDKIKKENK